MRGVRYAAVVVLGLPLAGCFAVPPKELPPWAMSPQAGNPEQGPGTRAPRKSRTAEATQAHAWGTPDEVKPFSAEWQARENALDNRLRRSMSICGHC